MTPKSFTVVAIALLGASSAQSAVFVSLDFTGNNPADHPENIAGDKTFRTHTFTDWVSAANDVTFRFAPRNNGAGSTGNIHVNAVSVEGTFTSVPEPSSALLADLATLFLARRRRQEEILF